MLLSVRALGGLLVVAVTIAAAFLARNQIVETKSSPARWFAPGALGHEPGVRSSAPGANAYFTRAFSGLNTPASREWGTRNALTPALGFSHNLNTVFPAKLFAAHPEFFPLADGKRLQPPERSYFWNPDIARPDVADYAARAARAHFEANPQPVSFALGVNDALIWGESPELLALATPTRWFRERPDYSAVAFTFMNRVAAQLSVTHPEKYVGALAYYWTEQLPPFPLHPQVIPFLTADRSQGYDPAFWQEEMALQQAWGEAAGRRPNAEVTADAASRRRLGIYDYVYGGGFLIPRIHTKLLADHLRHARRAGFTDYYAEVNPNWGLDGPMPWMTAQLVLDPEQDREALLAEYYTRYFAEAAEPMRRFFERCEELWMAQVRPAYWLKHYRNEAQAVVFPVEALAGLRRSLDEAGAVARAPRIAARVRLVGETFGVSERYVHFQQARNDVLRAALRGRDRTTVAAALERYGERRREFVGYTLALRKRHPHALHPFDWSDYLKNDPIPTAMAVLDGERAVGSERQLLVDAAFAGTPLPPRMIAGMHYGVALPAGWRSQVEPSEFHRAELQGDAGGKWLLISATKDTTVSQWAKLDGAGLHIAKFSVRGRVSTSAAVSLVFSFLDAAHRHVGFKAVRLPDGEWPEWVTLRQAGEVPARAAWVGMGLRVQNQIQGDWIEARDFSLSVAVP